jgi:hypothetical protein
MDRVLAGAPWIAGKHAVILKEYDEKLKPSEIRFDSMGIWGYAASGRGETDGRGC